MIVGPIIALLAIVGVIAIVIWVVQFARGHEHRRTALDILDERFARGEIDKREFEEKRTLLGE